MCENCVCDCCAKFGCCYCGCDCCSRKCCGCATCTICSTICGLIFAYFLLAIILIYGFPDDDEPEIEICNSIEFKPQHIKCNSNNILYIDLSYTGEGGFHNYRINLYNNSNIEAVYNKEPFLFSYLQGNVFASEEITETFNVIPGEYSLEFIDNDCREVFYENIYVPPFNSSCDKNEDENTNDTSNSEDENTNDTSNSEDGIIEQEIAISIYSSYIPEFVIIMDISGSMSDVIDNYIKTIILMFFQI